VICWWCGLALETDGLLAFLLAVGQAVRDHACKTDSDTGAV
jgi:hypothetical protein